LASELAIAAIEKNGGVVTTAFYDPRSLGKIVFDHFLLSLFVSYWLLFKPVLHFIAAMMLRVFNCSFCCSFLVFFLMVLGGV
jgi:hypothetical protein